MAEVGRPPKFESAEQLESLIESYFEDCKQRNEPPFITELCVWLDTSRKVLLEYEEKTEFSNTIKRAKAKCEMAVEKGMMLNKMNATASIFNLKNNYDWKDKTESEVTNRNYIIQDGDTKDNNLDTPQSSEGNTG